MNRKGIIILMVLTVVTAVMAVATGRKEEQRRKARYYYTQGSVEQALDHHAEAYEYFRKAYETDPGFVEAASAYGTSRLAIESDTLMSEAELRRTLEMMRSYVDAYPEDLYESIYYGYIATQLDTLPEAIRVLERTAHLHPESANVHLQLSDVYLRTGEYGKAANALDEYESQEGMNMQITTRKLQYLLADRDTIRALREVSRLVASDTTNADYALLKGNLFEALGQNDSTIYYYRRAERLDPESGHAKLALAEFYELSGDSAAYENIMYEVLFAEQLDLDTKADYVAQYLQNAMKNSSETARADTLFAALREQYPHEPRILDLAARYSGAKHDYADAVEQISYAIDRDPDNRTYRGQLMTYLAGEEKFDSALNVFETLPENIERDSPMKYLYATIAMSGKRFDKAVGMYREMILDVDSGLNPDSVSTLYDLRKDITLDELDQLSVLYTEFGDALHEAKQQQASYRAYQTAINFDDNNAMAYNNYAYFSANTGGDLDKALELSKKSISGDQSENPTYLDTYAWINYLRGDYATAEEYQRKAIGLLTANQEEGATVYVPAEFLDHFGDILAAMSKPDEALAAWKEAEKVYREEKETDSPEYEKLIQKIKHAEK